MILEQLITWKKNLDLSSRTLTKNQFHIKCRYKFEKLKTKKLKESTETIFITLSLGKMFLNNMQKASTKQNFKN